jgi:hypothetical protein
MNVLFNTVNRINYLITDVPQKLKKYSDEELSHKPAPGKWSKKEILGHLCDSAVNNLGRFIRAQYEPAPFAINSYQQDEWVRVNNYHGMEIKDILELWVILNQRILHVLTNMPEDKLAVEVIHDGAVYTEPIENKTVLWMFEDYLAHMEHHLAQLGIMN